MFKRVIPDPPIDTILPLKGAHKQVAIEWIIKLIKEHDDKQMVLDMIGINLKDTEYRKVMKEVDKVVNQLNNKIRRIQGHGNDI